MDSASVVAKKPEPSIATLVAVVVAASRPCWVMLEKPDTETPPDEYEVALLDAVTRSSNDADVVL